MQVFALTPLGFLLLTVRTSCPTKRRASCRGGWRARRPPEGRGHRPAGRCATQAHRGRPPHGLKAAVAHANRFGIIGRGRHRRRPPMHLTLTTLFCRSLARGRHVRSWPETTGAIRPTNERPEYAGKNTSEHPACLRACPQADCAARIRHPRGSSARICRVCRTNARRLGPWRGIDACGLEHSFVVAQD